MNNKVTLDMLPSGRRAKIVSIVGGRGLTYRLYQMGFTPGAIVEVVSNYGYGPIIVRVMGVETAIGRGVARKILVEPL
ncbi:MAG: iron transporter FeoA [Desulfurococcales archaeon ex4484_58]|nr:MAG: iron transporter FeoA [Desulfurococcales archaeon ex4484_58]